MISELVETADIRTRYGIPTSTMYNWIKRGIFPKPIKIGLRKVAWRAEDIEAWLAERERQGQGGRS